MSKEKTTFKVRTNSIKYYQNNIHPNVRSKTSVIPKFVDVKSSYVLTIDIFALFLLKLIT